MNVRRIAIAVALAALLGAGALLWRSHRQQQASALAPAAVAGAPAPSGLGHELVPPGAPQTPALTDEQKHKLVEQWKAAAANPEADIRMTEEQQKLAAKIRASGINPQQPHIDWSKVPGGRPSLAQTPEP